jgi:iron complex outermembrane receptor protein
MRHSPAPRSLRRTALGALAALSTWAAQPASAQSAAAADPQAQTPADPTAPADAASAPPLEDILIVAPRKRSEQVHDVPLSITAFGETQLQDLDVRRLNDLTDHVANLQFGGATGSSSVARIHLRGIGSTDTIATVDPSVGVYVDGVYLARNHGAMLAVSDLDHVEVLRGPQGTLFGKNTAGGAIQIFTQRPVLNETEGYLQLRAGNYGRFDTRFGLNLPLVPEQSALRLSFASATRDGFFDNVGRGPSKLGDDKMLAGRAQLLLQPGPESELRWSLERSRERRTPRGAECVVSKELTASDPPTGVRVRPFIGPLQRFHAACRASASREIDQVASDLSFAKDHLDSTASALSWSWNIADDVTFRSITSWRRQDVEERFDLDATRESVGERDSIDAGREQQDQVTQELQWLGEGAGGRLQYVFGLYGFSEKTRDRDYFGNFVNTALLPGAPGQPPIRGALRVQRLKLDNRSYAAFFHSTYQLSEQWSVDLGVRRTQERKRADRVEQVTREGIYGDPCAGTALAAPLRGVTVPGVGVVPVVVASPRPLACSSFERSARFSDWSPLARVSWTPREDLHLYAGWSRGFKSGGFNGRADDPRLLLEIADEKVSSYELGFKQQWLDGAVRLSGALFHTLHEDIQRTIPTVSSNGVGLGVVVLNAGEAVLRGGELELSARLAPGLELHSSLGVLHGRYTEFDNPRDPEAADADLQYAPPYSLSVGLSYEHLLAGGGSLRLQTDWSHIAAYAIDAANSRPLLQGKHGELSAQLIWTWNDELTEVALWGNNLLDRRYLTSGINFGDSFGSALRYYSDPRTYGAEIRRRF